MQPTVPLVEETPRRAALRLTAHGLVARFTDEVRLLATPTPLTSPPPSVVPPFNRALALIDATPLRCVARDRLLRILFLGATVTRRVVSASPDMPLRFDGGAGREGARDSGVTRLIVGLTPLSQILITGRPLASRRASAGCRPPRRRSPLEWRDVRLD